MIILKGGVPSVSFLWRWEKTWVVFTRRLSIVISLINSQFFDSLCLFWLKSLQSNSILEECLILWSLTVDLKCFIHVFQWLSWEAIEDTALVRSVRIIGVRSFMVLFSRTIKKRLSFWHVSPLRFDDYSLLGVPSSPVMDWNWPSVEKLISRRRDLCWIIMGPTSFPADLLVVIEDWWKGVVHFILLVN